MKIKKLLKKHAGKKSEKKNKPDKRPANKDLCEHWAKKQCGRGKGCRDSAKDCKARHQFLSGEKTRFAKKHKIKL